MQSPGTSSTILSIFAPPIQTVNLKKSYGYGIQVLQGVGDSL